MVSPSARCPLCRRRGEHGRYDRPVLNPAVFKAYDVRGSTPTSSTRRAPTRSGARTSSSSSRGACSGKGHAAVCTAMASAAIEGAADAGADVVDIGMVGTEMLYCAVGELGLEGGIAVTASHNPKRVHRDEDRAARGTACRRRLGAAGDPRACAGGVRGCRTARHGERGGRLARVVERVLSFVDVEAIKPLRVVIDAANGMAGAMLPPVLERLPLDPVTCFFEPDGSFPNHEPNPLLPENREFIVRRRSRRVRTSASRSTATPTAASSWTTAANSCPATSQLRSSPSRCSPRSPAEA